MFKKVLIANRGEIACRIERTLRKMGIASVAVYTKADQDSLHVDQADEAVLIGDGPAKESYLDSESIIDAAIKTGAEAIHPGYGFLSENADFAERCAREDITFIGPTPEQIKLFGLKHSARKIATEAGVPLLPGTGLIQSPVEAVREAEKIGYPVILKSTAGGGGIGMRICNTEEELQNTYESVKYLSEKNFNNGGLFLEKYIHRARHIEVQIFGTQAGIVTTLGERDCSIQRRNQKVVEETPAPLLPDNVRQKMFHAAKALAQAVHYQSAGTVEFLYDVHSENFYFLEVNTRLQVEHGVTEEVLKIDLVELMLREASGEFCGLNQLSLNPEGHSIQVRIYAEDQLHDFRPSPGKLDHVLFSDVSRNETWVRDGVTVSPFYDPMLAKIIVHGKNREDAVRMMDQALSETKLYGITTNLHYLQALFHENDYRKGRIHTQFLKDFHPAEQAIEVLDGGLQSTVQDWPGRVGYWGVGVPPSGPMDNLSFRTGNRILGNREEASGLELTVRGGSYRLRGDLVFCITGADMQATLDGETVPMYSRIHGKKGQTLTFKKAEAGMRTYLLAGGGFDMPQFLGSSATFTLGHFGGHGGRALKAGDVLRTNPYIEKPKIDVSYPKPVISHNWTIGVIPGPHSSKEFLKPEYVNQLTETDWKVHFNSSRTGVRLIGPAPLWSREDGGEAGLHPSNVHDVPYAVGAIDLTGDMPILLGPDGPSLGGFVCPVTIALSELWKMGQLHPEDTVHFSLITLEEADDLRKRQESALNGKKKSHSLEPATPVSHVPDLQYPILFQESQGRQFPITIRCSGDDNLLIEYGGMELNLLFRFQVHHLMLAIQEDKSLPIIDLTPGIRSLQVHFDPSKVTPREMCRAIISIDRSLEPLESARVPSRIVRLPLSWNDPATQLAIRRYQQNVRPDAPWCPSNLEFIRRINGLDSIEDVKKIVFNANYLVLGLGDVYLGAPVAVPTDPRHLLVTTKYNPARTWTPENAVGIGGAYMCVYGMEGPGGYQFVGRTIQMWNPLRSTKSFKPGKPWLLRFFDQIRFYPVSADELLQDREDFLRGRFEADITETTFDLGEYMSFLDNIKNEAKEFRTRQEAAFDKEKNNWHRLGLDKFVSEHEETPYGTSTDIPEGSIAVNSQMPGSVWKVLVKNGQKVKKGDTLIIEESMKMEFPQKADEDGTITSILVKPGDEVHAGQTLLSIRI
ncbi:urea carboxylase [Sporolactobacillus shoreae]|uniref:Urea carboxylase n=1 Tax=Sporolactobacillus shoreae TaxID=1465501 RepID=A0A4Z0GNZ2_9BACL|nr:urea carboxylase [Sporolactobacillus shoreae]TGA98311.1 urea carboxylase [Sporolactobacillus shoreae]